MPKLIRRWFTVLITLALASIFLILITHVSENHYRGWAGFNQERELFTNRLNTTNLYFKDNQSKFFSNHQQISLTAEAIEGTTTYLIYLPLIEGESIQSKSFPLTGSPPNFENSDLEGMMPVWQSFSTNFADTFITDTTKSDTIRTLGITSAHSKQHVAWLGGANNETSIFSQTVTLPGDKNSGTLTFWYQIRSEELCVTVDNRLFSPDVARITVDDKILEEVPLCRDRNIVEWKSREIIVSGYAGQEVSFAFIILTDANMVSHFFLDDITLSP